MPESTDEIFLLKEAKLESLPARSMKDGFLGKSLEDALQYVLEQNPNLIPGRQIASSGQSVPKFVLLRREMPISGWSLDHLFADQYAVPTLLEAKLMQNPESRREVIGQIIEYAANASEIWANGKARAIAEDFYRQKSLDLGEVMLEAFGEDFDVESFWTAFHSNLEEGHIRLIVAADLIRPEVRRMIEYLNREMANAEVYGLEISCYGSDASSLVLVPRLLGQTQASADRKADSRKKISWTLPLMAAALDQMEGGVIKDRLSRIYKWAAEKEAFAPGTADRPLFSVRNRFGKRQMGFNQEGTGYICLALSYFDGNLEVRNEFFSQIKAAGLVKSHESIESITDGRYYAKGLDALSDEEFDHLFLALEAVV